MKKILITTDFSESCDHTVEYVKEMVKDSDIKIDLLHSYHLPFVSTMKELEVDVRRELEVTHKYYKAKLNARLNELPFANRGEAHLAYGLFPSSDIADKVANINPDLVVMAMRKNYTRTNKIMGAVTSRTIDKTQAPVLAVPYGSRFLGWSKILLPTQLERPYLIEDKMKKLTQWLKRLSLSAQNTEIDVVHIVASKEDKLEISYPNQPSDNVNFRVSYSPTVEAGIDNIKQHNEYSMMIIDRSKSNMLRRLFNSSKTTKWMYDSKLPVLVL